MFVPRLRIAVLAVAASMSLSACYDEGYGYGGMSVGYGRGYGGGGYYGGGYYGDGYYDDGYYNDGYYGDGYYGDYYGGYPSYYGWYGGFYYPGTGFYIYDRWGKRHRWNDRHRRYWESHRGNPGANHHPNWGGYQQHNGQYQAPPRYRQGQPRDGIREERPQRDFSPQDGVGRDPGTREAIRARPAPSPRSAPRSSRSDRRPRRN